MVGRAMSSLPKPFTEDVIDEVFQAIEGNPQWRTEYDQLCSQLGQVVVNTWGGFYISSAAGGKSVRQVPAAKSTLIQSYSKIEWSPGGKRGKLKEAEARQLMSDHFKNNKATLPAAIRERRDFIIELLVQGKPVEEAFDLAVADLD